MDRAEFIRRLEECGFPKSEYMIMSGGSMLMRGLRQSTEDMDLCISEKLAAQLDLEHCPKNSKGYYSPFEDMEVSVNLGERPYDTVDGFQCETLESVLEFKRSLMRDKDIRDIEAIERYLNAKKEIRGRISIVKADITGLDADAIVNAANSGLAMGGGVCGAIFRAAGPAELQMACRAIGHCPAGSAVITSGFALKARHVIHAVGPVWSGGSDGEPELLRSCYTSSLSLAEENGLKSVAFPLISSGIYGYPRDLAWREALTACRDYLTEHPGSAPDITFAVLDDGNLRLGLETMNELF